MRVLTTRRDFDRHRVYTVIMSTITNKATVSTCGHCGVSNCLEEVFFIACHRCSIFLCYAHRYSDCDESHRRLRVKAEPHCSTSTEPSKSSNISTTGREQKETGCKVTKFSVPSRTRDIGRKYRSDVKKENQNNTRKTVS